MSVAPERAGGRPTTEIVDGICHLGLNEPEHMNPWSTAMSTGLRDAVTAALRDDCRRFIVYGHGDNFSAPDLGEREQ